MARDITGIEHEQYVHIGPILGVGETAIKIDQALQFRDFVAQDYLPRMTARVVDLSQTHDKSLCGARQLITLPSGVEAERYVTVMLQHGPDYWRLAAMISRAYRSTWNNEPAKVAVRYALEVWGKELLEARRETRLVRTIGALTAEQIAQEGQEYFVQRKKTERPMTGDDLAEIRGLLIRVAKWRNAVK